MRTWLLLTCLAVSACADVGVVSKNGLISDVDPPTGFDTDGTHPDQLDSGGPTAEGGDPSPWLDPNIKDPRPVEPPDTDIPTGDTGGDTDSTPGGDTGSTPGSDTDTVTNPGGDTDSTPGGDTGSNPGGDTDTVPGGDTGSNPGGDTDTNPGSDTDTVPGGDTDTTPGSDTDIVPGGDTDTNPGSDTDTVPDTFDTADTGAWTDTDTVATPRPGTCQRASRIPGYLDRFQTPGDGKVVFCHRTSAGNWTLIDTSTSACIHHAGHLLDLFPRTLCDN